MSGFCESESRTVGRTVFRLADGGAGLSARSEMLRHREDTGDIPQRVEFDIALPDSVGYFYSEFTEFLGFQRNSDEWKVMGLAPYGKPGVDLSNFIDVKA